MPRQEAKKARAEGSDALRSAKRHEACLWARSSFSSGVLMIFLPFIHWDFTPYLFGGLHWFDYTTFGISIAIVSIYIILFLVSSYILFNFKDIKNQ